MHLDKTQTQSCFLLQRSLLLIASTLGGPRLPSTHVIPSTASHSCELWDSDSAWPRVHCGLTSQCFPPRLQHLAPPATLLPYNLVLRRHQAILRTIRISAHSGPKSGHSFSPQTTQATQTLWARGLAPQPRARLELPLTGGQMTGNFLFPRRTAEVCASVHFAVPSGEHSAPYHVQR